MCYTYDNNGNILTKDVNGERTEYRYQEGSDRLVSFGTETFSYDAVGNPVVYRGMACEWEKGRQLKTVCDGTNKVEYEYNAFGLRTAKKVYTPETAAEPAETTTYVYENGQLLRQVTGSEVIDFLYGAGGIIGIRINAANYMYRKNVFGDVTELYSESGEVVGRYSYSAYGECVVEQDAGGIATKNPIRYRGYYYDESLSMYYLKSRYYDPEIGRFMTIDSVTYISASINGTNLYAYCYGNPVLYLDGVGKAPVVNIGVDIWSLFNKNGYVWISGRYQPKRKFIGTADGFKNLVNNLLYIGEIVLNAFELRAISWNLSIITISNTGITLISAGVDLLDGRIYFSDTDYLSAKIGSVSVSAGIDWGSDGIIGVEAQATALSVGIYSEHLDAEFLVGSIGVSAKWENGALTIGASFIFGFKITIRF